MTAAKLPWQCPTSMSTILEQIDTWLSNTPVGNNGNNNKTELTLFGSDCLFFESFHIELARLVLKWLVHFQGARDAGGTVQVLLFAPSRGGSLERFVEILRKEHQQQLTTTSGSTTQSSSDGIISSSSSSSTISIAVTSGFDEHVSRVRREVADKEPRFNPDRHLPMLVTIY